MDFQIDRNNTYKAGFYIRLSKEDENPGESQSVTNQRELLKTFAQSYNITDYDYYIDDGYSGTNFDRPSFCRLKEDIQSGKINLVVTKDLSRLGRDYIMTGYYTEKFFPEHNVRYISLLDGTDTDADGGMNDFTPFKAILNDMYAKDISRKIKSIKHDKQKKGLFIGGKAPYGYILSPCEKNKIEVDPIAANVVKQIFKMATNGTSCADIAKHLNLSGIPSPSVYAGKIKTGEPPILWNSGRIREILKNRMYIGSMVQGKTKKLNYKSQKTIRIPACNHIVVPNTHPPLVEKEIFEAANVFLQKTSKTRLRTYDYELRGLVFCQECSACMGVVNRPTKRKPKNLYFICRSYRRNRNLCTCHCISVDAVTYAVKKAVYTEIQKFIDSSDFDIFTKKLISNTFQKSTSTQWNGIKKEISVLNQKCDRLYLDCLNGMICKEDFERLYSHLIYQREQYNAMLALSENISLKKPIDTQAIKHFLLEELPHKREFLCNIINKIEISAQKEISVFLNFSLS